MKILYAATWFPFPPTFGAKSRAFHLLSELARKHEIALVSFADVPIEPAWLQEMQRLCVRVDVVPSKPFEQNRFKKALALFSPIPGFVASSYSHQMMALVKQVAVEWHPDCLLAWTFVTAPYILAARQLIGKPALFDSDNLMTQMLHEQIASSTGLLQRLWRWLAWLKMKRYERSLFSKFDLNVLASPRDLERVSQEFGLSAKKFAVVPNGINLVRNHPGLAVPKMRQLVFNGSITYGANFDAVDYFLREVWPLVLAREPDMHLSVTGSTQDIDLSRFARSRNISFTGFIDDIRPVIAGSGAVVAPLRQGGGTRLKILEAMALGTPVISTSKGIEGLSAKDGVEVLIADNARDFADAIMNLSTNAELRTALATRARALVERYYDWSNIGQSLSSLLEGMSYSVTGTSHQL